MEDGQSEREGKKECKERLRKRKKGKDTERRDKKERERERIGCKLLTDSLKLWFCGFLKLQLSFA